MIAGPIDQALYEIFEEAIEKRIREVEIIPGKGSGQFTKKSGTFFTTTAYKTALSQDRKRQQKFRKVICLF
jgi:hypothetical protein